MQDEEKYPVKPEVVAEPSDKSSASGEDEVPPYMRNASKKGVLAKLRGWEEALDRKIGVETHGISRRRPEDRDPAYGSWSNQAVMFLVSVLMRKSCDCGGEYAFLRSLGSMYSIRHIYQTALFAHSISNYETLTD